MAKLTYLFLAPMISVFGFVTTDLKKPTPLPFVYNADHVSVGFQFDLKNLLQKASCSEGSQESSSNLSGIQLQ